MNHSVKYIISGAIVLAAMATGITVYIHQKSQTATQPEGTEDKTPLSPVTTAPLRQGDISTSITAFGSVTAQPGEVAVFSVPYECRVKRILVSSGQQVEKAVDLIEVEPSPGARLALQEAQSNLEVATKDAEQAQQRFTMKLSTNSEQLQSQQTLKLAQLRLDNLKQQGLGSEDHPVLKTESPGLIAKVDVQQGQIIAAGNPLIETVARDQVEVRLGVEPATVTHLAVGQTVKLYPNSNESADPVTGKIRLITQRVNPDTRLVDIFVIPESRDALLLDGFVRGEVVTDTKSALIAPHDAVLPGDNGFTLFTVKDGKAVKHTVTLGLQNDREVAVTADDLHAGDRVVVLGNLELDDNVPVEEENAAKEQTQAYGNHGNVNDRHELRDNSLNAFADNGAADQSREAAATNAVSIQDAARIHRETR